MPLNFFPNNKNNYINKKELVFNIIIYLIIIYFFFSTYKYLKILIHSHSGDTSLFIDIIDKITKYNDYHLSTVHSTFFHFFFGGYLGSDPNIYCDIENITRKKYFNMYEVSHLYFIVWLLSIPSKLGIDIVSLSTFYISIIYTSIFFLCFVFLKNKVSKINTIFFLILLILWKPISLSMFGQYYIDKFYLIFMLIYILLHLNFRETYNYKLIKYLFLASILTISVHERAALMLSIFILLEQITHNLFNLKKFEKRDFKFLIFGTIIFMYYLIYTKFYQNTPLGHHLNFSQIIIELKQILEFGSYKNILSLKMLIVLLPLLFFSFFEKRLFLITIVSIMPNLLISIGGAEKIGFSTHYHTYYIPFLISSSLYGFVRYNKFSSQKFFNKIPILIFFILIISYNENSQRILAFDYNIKNTNLAHSITLNQDKLRQLNKNKEFDLKIRKYIKDDNPNKNIKISMNETFMTSFFLTDYIINVFPLEISKSDYLITSIKNENLYVPSFLNSIDKKDEISMCFQKYINNNFIILRKLSFNSEEVVIYKKI